MASADLASLARDLRQIHDAVLAGGTPPRRPRAVVARSWERVLGLGVDPDRRYLRDPLSIGEVETRRRTTRLAAVVDDLRGLLAPAAEASEYLVVITDADGIVLWRSGAPRVKHHADVLGFAEGALWTEEAVGTNAIGTALAEAAPVQLFSAEHFENAQVPWYCTAAPIHDPVDGALLGVVDVSGPALTLHPAIRALVTAAVRLAEAQLWRDHAERLDRLRRTSAPLITSGDGPLLVVDDHGWVAVQQGVASAERVAAPRPDLLVAVPGLGLCLPERVPGGWLIRGREQPRSVTATLDLSVSPAMLRVDPGSAPWLAPLNPRPAQLLAALAAAGPAGMTADQLSRVLFGDGDHKVTVRAEVSRMRRVIGALVATSPYRIADGVTVDVVG